MVVLVSIVFLSSTFSKGFSSETTGPISFKFHIQLSGKEGKKVYIFGGGHMTKMATMPIYNNIIKKYSFLEPLGQLP